MLVLDQLLADLKAVCAAFPDKRKSEGIYSMADIGLSAFSLFFVQSDSFLAFQRRLEEGHKTSNCQTLIFPSWDTLMTTLIDSKPPPDIVARIAT
jgi:hypothetical protein